MPLQTGADPIRTRDVDEAQALGSDLLYPQRLDVLDRSTPLDLTMFAGRIGPIFIADCHYATDIRITCGDLTTSYHVNVPLSGHLVTTQGRSTVVATPTMAAVYGPQGNTVLDNWSGDCRQLCVKLDKSALDATLSERVGRGIAGPIPLEPTLDLREGAGRSWADLVIMLTTQLHRPDSLVHQPLVAAPLASSLLNGLLSAADHPYHEMLDAPPEPCRPPVITQAIEFMQEYAAHPLTTADIAAHCSVSMRTLQMGFQKHVGQSPLQYLRRIRLRRAHEDLVSANPYEDSVGSIANRWGFAHLSRFAAAHTAEYGVPPSHTLHAGF
ncbi:AraC family transcriptional regulator [Streptomyces sp. NPDC001982]|uniref:AraC family transcriptional regulator n=1 Tax=unclassified Streptomyces TaxID=2593676 RepID=UPI00332DEB58